MFLFLDVRPSIVFEKVCSVSCSNIVHVCVNTYVSFGGLFILLARQTKKSQTLSSSFSKFAFDLRLVGNTARDITVKELFYKI